METRIGNIKKNIEKGFFLSAFIEVANSVSDTIIEELGKSHKEEVIIRNPTSECSFISYDSFTGEEGEYYLLRVRNGKGIAKATFGGKFCVENLIEDEGKITENDIENLMVDGSAFETTLDDYELLRLSDSSRVYDIVRRNI